MSFDVVRDAMPRLGINMEYVEVIYVDGKPIFNLADDFCLVGDDENVTVYFKDGTFSSYLFANMPDGSNQFVTMMEKEIAF